jgi:hypothetical protein
MDFSFGSEEADKAVDELIARMAVARALGA